MQTAGVASARIGAKKATGKDGVSHKCAGSVKIGFFDRSAIARGCWSFEHGRLGHARTSKRLPV